METKRYTSLPKNDNNKKQKKYDLWRNDDAKSKKAKTAQELKKDRVNKNLAALKSINKTKTFSNKNEKRGERRVIQTLVVVEVQRENGRRDGSKNGGACMMYLASGRSAYLLIRIGTLLLSFSKVTLPFPNVIDAQNPLLLIQNQ